MSAFPVFSRLLLQMSLLIHSSGKSDPVTDPHLFPIVGKRNSTHAQDSQRALPLPFINSDHGQCGVYCPIPDFPSLTTYL